MDLSITSNAACTSDGLVIERQILPNSVRERRVEHAPECPFLAGLGSLALSSDSPLPPCKADARIVCRRSAWSAWLIPRPIHKQPQPNRIPSITKASAVVPQRTRSPGGPRNTQPADQPLTAGLRRPTSRLLAQLKQLPRLASKFGRKPKQVVQSSRPITAAPVDLFPVADPQ